MWEPKLNLELTNNLKRTAGVNWHTALDGTSVKFQHHLESPSKKVKYLNSLLKILHNLRQNNSNAFKNKSHFSNTLRDMDSKL